MGRHQNQKKGMNLIEVIPPIKTMATKNCNLQTYKTTLVSFAPALGSHPHTTSLSLQLRFLFYFSPPIIIMVYLI